MLFDMGIGEILVIAVVGLLIFGPDRLPTVAAQAAQLLRQLRQQADDAKSAIMDAADIDTSTLRDLRDLDPRHALKDVTAPLDEARQAAERVVRDPSDRSTGSTPRRDAVDPHDIV